MSVFYTSKKLCSLHIAEPRTFSMVRTKKRALKYTSKRKRSTSSVSLVDEAVQMPGEQTDTPHKKQRADESTSEDHITPSPDLTVVSKPEDTGISHPTTSIQVDRDISILTRPAERNPASETAPGQTTRQSLPYLAFQADADTEAYQTSFARLLTGLNDRYSLVLSKLKANKEENQALKEENETLKDEIVALSEKLNAVLATGVHSASPLSLV